MSDNRFGWPHLVAIAVGIGCGYALSCNGPVSRVALQQLDSAKIANAAFDSSQTLAAQRFNVLADSFEQVLDSAKRLQGVRVVRVNVATSGTQAAVETLLVVVDSAFRPLVLAVRDSLAALTFAHDQERAAAAHTLRVAELRGDTAKREVARLTGALATAQKQRDGGIEREAGLVAALTPFNLSAIVSVPDPKLEIVGTYRVLRIWRINVNAGVGYRL